METEYLDLLQEVFVGGHEKSDRTGTGTRSVFGRQIRCNLQDGFPAITTKKLWWKGVVAELLWLLSGSTNVEPLQDQGVHIWDEWADKETGDLGPVYGKQWRAWANYRPGNARPYHMEHVDQIANVIQTIKTNPNSRRMVVSAWNVGELSQMKLEPCHAFFQFYVANGKLSLQMYQRSADLFLGVPFNIASYALLTHLIAQVTGLEVGEYIHTFGDAHIYNNHLEQVDLQLSRRPMTPPKLWLNPEIKDIDGFKLDDIRLEGYACHPSIAAPVAI